jgi:hypothetical protein
MPAFVAEPVDVAVPRSHFACSRNHLVDADHRAFILGVITMRTAALSAEVATKRSTLRLHRPPADMARSPRWRINGFPATILIWTAEEWARLTDRPIDAQEYPNGVWCALRIE